MSISDCASILGLCPVKEISMQVKGRDLVSGIPQDLTITSEEIRKAISEQVEGILQAVRVALEQTPPELAANIVDRGIVLTGGKGQLRGLDDLLRNETSLPITVVEDPLSTKVRNEDTKKEHELFALKDKLKVKKGYAVRIVSYNAGKMSLEALSDKVYAIDPSKMTKEFSVDPLADKYPHLSPYAYCADNPAL